MILRDRWWWLPALLAATVLSAPVSATDANQDYAAGKPVTLRSPVDASVPAKYRLVVERAQVEGRLLQQEDRAAWVASDALVAKSVLSAHPNATGWLATQQDADGDHWLVSFTETGPNGAKHQDAFADVGVALSGDSPGAFDTRVQINDPPRPLGDYERFFAQYRDMLLKADNWLRCSKQYNYSVSLFIEDGEKYAVVKLLPARMGKEYPLGGFHEFRFPMLGEGGHRKFSQTNTCVTVDPEGKEPSSLMVSHLTSETPTQFHVFMSLSYDKPIYVSTVENNLLWVVEKGLMRIATAGDKQGAAVANALK